MLPRFSVITPSYNQAAYLEQTIQSVLDQGYPDLEYMIVDGGSKDGSLEIIKKYEKYLAWWVSEPDHGQAEAVNKGFSRATGEFVGWINSDDFFEPGALLSAAEYLQQDARLGLVYGDVRSIDGSGATTNIMRFANWGLDDLMCFKFISQPGTFMRRSVLQQAGYIDASYHYLLDHVLWLCMAQLAPIQYVPRLWATARFHAAAKNLSGGERYGQDAYRIVAWMQADPAFAERFQRLHRPIWAGAHRINARYLLDGGQTHQSLAAYWKCLAAYPPAVLPEWRRILYAMLLLLGVRGLRARYMDWRRKRYEHWG
jgi:glycosyltransferase involved in cell wall biosynthesis